MHHLLLALLCAAPLMAGYTAYEPAPEPATQVEAVYLTSMGCDLADCADPAHYHHCEAGCTDPGHYHDCPVGCQEASHPHSGGHHGESQDHHGGHHH